MNKKILILAIAIVAFIAASGCIQPPVCGNGTCETGETAANCLADCGPTPGSLEVTVVSSLIGATPLSGAKVVVAGYDSNFAVTEYANSDGIALFESLSAGAYYITASKEGYLPADANAEVVAGQTTSVRIKLRLEIPEFKCGDGKCIYPEDANNCTADCGTAGTFNTIAIGDNKIVYTDRAGIKRSIPFYIKLANTSTQSTFIVDNQTFYYRCSTQDVNLMVPNGSYLNGKLVELFSKTYGVEMYTDNCFEQVSASGKNITFGGVQFTTAGASTNPLKVYLIADGNCQFSRQPFSNPNYLTVSFRKPLNNTLYYDDDNVSRQPIKQSLDVNHSAMKGAYRYHMYVERASAADGDIYLLLGLQGLTTDNNKGIMFNMVDTTEDLCGDKPYYWPDAVDFGNYPNDNQYLVGDFFIIENEKADMIDVMIDTATHNTIVPNSETGLYKGCVYYDLGFPCLKRDSITPLNYVRCNGVNNSATTAYGSKITVDVNSGVATIKIPVKEIVCSSSDPSKINVKDANVSKAPANGQKDFGAIVLSNLTGGNMTSVALSSATGAFARNTATTLGLSAAYSAGAKITLTPDEMITGGRGKTTYSGGGLTIAYTDFAGLSRDVTISCSGTIMVNNA